MFGVIVACGTRTDLDIDGPTGAGPDASSDARGDAPGDAADAKPDVIVTDIGCRSDADCRDAVGCTLDLCDQVRHVCTRTLRDEACADGLFCNGDERCDAVKGCVPGARACADSIACTDDACDEKNRRCTHDPNDARCPISHTCDPALGCQARALAVDRTTLYEVRLPSGQVKAVGATGAVLTDVALAPSNVLYASSSSGLYRVNQSTGAATSLGGMVPTFTNALDAAPDGTLYLAGAGTVARFDPATSAVTPVATFPAGMAASGDLAFVGGRLLGSATTGGLDDLVEFDLSASTARVLGSIGYTCVWGLAAYGPTLYGLTCEGRVLSIDTTTGKGRELNKVDVRFYGASAR